MKKRKTEKNFELPTFQTCKICKKHTLKKNVAVQTKRRIFNYFNNIKREPFLVLSGNR
jgi:hypothetical protein